MMGPEDLRPLPLFTGLEDEQLAGLVDGGRELRFGAGDVLFREGEHADVWWVLLDGALELIRHVGREDTVVGRMDVPGRWAGGFRAWDEHGVYLATGRGLTAGRVLQVPAATLRRCVDAWFPFGSHLVEGLYGTARSIEATARQRAALVTLGTLAAGLAHEINNPAAAAVRAVSALERSCDTLLSALGRLAEGRISADQFLQLDALRRRVPASGRSGAPLDALRLADQEDAVADWMADHGVEDGWDLAPVLAAAGADVAWCEEVAAVLPGPELGPGLEWLASTYGTTSLLAEVAESTRRISELVGAVRSYSQMDRAAWQRVDVTEGIESTLLILGHRLRDGVTVLRDYGSGVPQVHAYAGELNQVWTNLIDNAVDAMAGSGTLRVSTRADGDSVIVEVADTGPGMPEAVAARAFEAFFTTKDVGQGTGLGLDIARRIVVDRHRGDISIASRPGDTVLRVRLPAAGPPD